MSRCIKDGRKESGFGLEDINTILKQQIFDQEFTRRREDLADFSYVLYCEFL